MKKFVCLIAVVSTEVHGEYVSITCLFWPTWNLYLKNVLDFNAFVVKTGFS